VVSIFQLVVFGRRIPDMSKMKRRQFLSICGTGLLLPSSSLVGAEDKKESHPLASFDREIEKFMEPRKMPGAALAVVKDRRLVYAQGYGWADREKQLPAKPDSLFRIASISKPITAVAVLKLVEEKRLKLDDRVFDLVQLPPVLTPDKKPDPRLQRITILQLLQHTGGWDRDKSFDPMFRSKRIAEAVGVPAPAGPEAIIRYMLGQSLDFDPGTRYAYSNFGYCVLGRIIEKVTGQPYADYMREKILAPAGIKRMRIGATLASRQAEGEVRYYTPDDGTAQSVFPGTTDKVPWPYGGFYLEAMDAHGAWIASAVDLARFAAALDDPQHSPLLKAESFRAMSAPPDAPVARSQDGAVEASYYGCGWSVRPVKGPGKANYWHTGSLPGTRTLLVRRWDGLSWAVLFNQRTDGPTLSDNEIDPALHRAAAAVTEWPRHDLFERYR
jgi:CubicO group peptidase (beta-lactamase class C family)